MSDYNYDTYDDLPHGLEDEEDDLSARKAWAIVSWIILVLTLVLNLVVIGILLVRRNAYNVVNKAILTVAIVDLLYGMFVSPFFVENYIQLRWRQSLDYCKFYEFYFTFHDLFIPLILILLSTYVSVKYAGATGSLRYKKPIYFALFVICLLFSLFMSIPATVHSGIFLDNPPQGQGRFKEECRTLDSYTMVLAYSLGSSLLFCFSMSFLFSLCIVGSPFLREIHDREEYMQRWRLMLTLSIVNSFYIITGFLLNFKEISRFLFTCCDFDEPFISIDTTAYDIWSFILLIAEPFLRPLTYLCFYFRYLMSDPLMD